MKTEIVYMDIYRHVYGSDETWTFKVGPERNGLELIEIVKDDGGCNESMSFTPGEALRVGEALIASAKEMMALDRG